MGANNRSGAGGGRVPDDIVDLAARLHVDESGAPGSTAIVFLHGVGNSGGMWAGHMAHLSSYHCLAPDLPGFGGSRHLPWTSMAHVADLVAELIRTRIPTRRAHVIGLSMGGCVTHTLLGRHHELLDRVIVDGAGVLPLRGTSLFNIGIAAFSPFLHTRPVVNGIARKFGFDEGSKEDLRAASTRAFRRGLTQANRTRLTKEETEAPCPTLLVAGEKELRVVRASNAALAHLMPTAQARYMPGHGHGWLGPAPDVHRRMVQAWITGSPLPPELGIETTPWSKPAVSRLIGRNGAR